MAKNFVNRKRNISEDVERKIKITVTLNTFFFEMQGESENVRVIKISQKFYNKSTNFPWRKINKT